ncbi:MAG: hypothetical protein ACE5IJ_06305 [Thermoplasmata archaeon]
MQLELLELVGLSAIGAGLIPVVQDFRTSGVALIPYLTAYVLLAVGAVATVLEGVLLYEILNFVEHFFGVTTAAVAFLFTTYLSHKHIRDTKKKGKRFGRMIR